MCLARVSTVWDGLLRHIAKGFFSYHPQNPTTNSQRTRNQAAVVPSHTHAHIHKAAHVPAFTHIPSAISRDLSFYSITIGERNEGAHRNIGEAGHKHPRSNRSQAGQRHAISRGSGRGRPRGRRHVSQAACQGACQPIRAGVTWRWQLSPREALSIRVTRGPAMVDVDIIPGISFLRPTAVASRQPFRTEFIAISRPAEPELPRETQGERRASTTERQRLV